MPRTQHRLLKQASFSLEERDGYLEISTFPYHYFSFKRNLENLLLFSNRNTERKLELWTSLDTKAKGKRKSSTFESQLQVLIKVAALALTSATAFTIYTVESTDPT